MSFSFDLGQGLILVDARVVGPVGVRQIRLALDTGATSTLINVEKLLALGYDPADSQDRARIVTGSGVEKVARVKIDFISALGRERSDFAIVAHTLPASAGIDGLLGLDFLGEGVLTVDFNRGTISLV
ncbi:MAG: aspartyl protease family protein [Fimbriimonas sp.]